MTDTRCEQNGKVKCTSENSRHPLIYSIKSVCSSMLFAWANPLIEAGSQSELTYEQMPELNKEFYHALYSSKVRYFFEQLRNQMNLSSSYARKTFITWLIFKSFKWDIAIALLLASGIQIFEYSTAFFIQQILAIKQNFLPDDYVKVFAILTGGMVLCKICSTFFSQYTAYFTVKSLGFVGEQKLLRSFRVDTRKNPSSIAQPKHQFFAGRCY